MTAVAVPARRQRARPAGDRKRADLRVVAPVRRRRRRVRLALTGTLAVSLLAVFGLVAFNVFLVQSQFRLERFEEQLEVERQEFERNRLEAARLSSPERILDLARNQLGMVDPAVVTHLSAPSRSPADPAAPSAEGARAWSEVKPYLAADP